MYVVLVVFIWPAGKKCFEEGSNVNKAHVREIINTCVVFVYFHHTQFCVFSSHINLSPFLSLMFLSLI